ncbi:MAG: aminotransferase, partial [Rhodobacteraceae bacterium]|nr:aminotransferase [Paracoccaceae bacterium]
MLSNTNAGGYFLYHSIGMYPGKDEDLARAMAEFAQVWAAPNDKQWGYVLRKRHEFTEHWGRLINAPKGSVTTTDNVTEGMHKLMRALPEGRLRGKRVLV